VRSALDATGILRRHADMQFSTAWKRFPVAIGIALNERAFHVWA
jgi:hypothetical protein